MKSMHNHVFWNMDKSPVGNESAQQMIEFAKSEGIDSIIIVSSFAPADAQRTKSEMLAGVKKLQETAKKMQAGIKFYPGMRVRIDDQLKKYWEEKAFCTLAESRYILIEFPATGIPQYASNILFELQLLGLTPIISHPERWTKLEKRPEYLSFWLDRGCLVQMDLESILGKQGRKIQNTAKVLLQRHVVHFIGIDSGEKWLGDFDKKNRKKSSQSLVDKVYAKMGKFIGEEEVESIFQKNPQLVMEDKPYVYDHTYEQSYEIPRKKRFGLFAPRSFRI